MENQVPAAPVAATPGTVTTDNPYGLQALWAGGDPIARGVLILLAIMSLASWYVILTKLWDQAKLKKSARVVEKQFWTAPSVKDGVDRLKKGDEFRVIAEDGLRAASHHDGRLTDRIDLHEWITMSLQRAVDGVISKMQNGLGLLATVGSTAPFVGLFGTVWGILNALVNIGVAGQASIDKVAGPVGEALIMTAIGLFVAVPAVMGYNWLLGRNKVLTDALRNFASDLHAYLVSGARVATADPTATMGGARPAAAKASPVGK
ncbi:MAG: MotA/TolQ/ExbB proton channel family protein [Gammaproteobacteria bacterium]|nr:MotA/TolQ/ExbB proton channel family protein [Gammaproteobacteria bacterium]MBV9622164.1 MotA/TolQ/ExbB proton channel family protein [Gammaproteobacteria bacterium]